MSRHISRQLKVRVTERAKNVCEYCRLPETFAYHLHEADHILPVKHGGAATFENLAFACWRCNRHKGSDIGSYDFETNGEFAPFFNPRKDVWTKHFRLNEDAEIIALTAEARVTVKILRFNDLDRIEERRELIENGLFYNFY